MPPDLTPRPLRTAFIDRRKQPFGHWPEQPNIVAADLEELGDLLV